MADQPKPDWRDQPDGSRTLPRQAASPARNPTTSTPRCPRTSCALTPLPTAHSLRHRTRPGRRHPGQSPAGRCLGPHPSRQQTHFAPGANTSPASSARSAYDAKACATPSPASCRLPRPPRTRLPADEGPASVTAEEGRPQEHRRRGGGRAPHGSAASADAPTSPRRSSDGPEGSGTSAATRCRLCRCR